MCLINLGTLKYCTLLTAQHRAWPKRLVFANGRMDSSCEHITIECLRMLAPCGSLFQNIAERDTRGNIKEQEGANRRKLFKRGKNDRGNCILSFSGLTLRKGVGGPQKPTPRYFHCRVTLFSVPETPFLRRYGPGDAWRSLLVAFLGFPLPLSPLIRDQGRISWKIKLPTACRPAPCISLSSCPGVQFVQT